MSSTKELKKATYKLYTENKNGLSAYGKGNTKAKIALWGGGLLVAWLVYREIKKALTKSDDEKFIDDIDQAIEYEEQTGNQLTYPLAQYSIYADTIEEATDTSGTDEEAIYSVFDALENNTDLLQLIKAYGERYSFYFGIPTGKYTLSQIIESELDTGEKVVVQGILDSKGITVKLY